MNPACRISSEELLTAITNGLVENNALHENLKALIDAKEAEFMHECQILVRQMQALKEENNLLKRKLKRYEQLPQSSESNSHQQALENFKKDVSSLIKEVHVKMNASRAARDEELSKCTAEYEECTEMLAKLHLKLSAEPYREKLLEYQDTRKASENIRGLLHIQLNDIEGTVNNKLARFKEINSKYTSELNTFLEENRGKLDELTSAFIRDVKLKEKILHKDTLRVGTKEVALFKSMLLSNSNEAQKNSRSIVVFDLPNSDQLQSVLDFLHSIDSNISLTEEDVEVTNEFDGQVFGNIIKITLPRASVVAGIMGNAAERNLYLQGNNIILMTYQQFLTQ